MTEDKNKKRNLSEYIEKKLQKKHKEFDESLNSSELKEIISDLHTYKIELELQNQELKRAQEKIENTKDNYNKLFNYAPVAYFILDSEATIKEVNLTAATLLDAAKDNITEKPFYRFVSKDSQDAFHVHFREVINKGKLCNTEIKIKNTHKEYFYARLESIADKDEEGNLQVRIALIDIDKRKEFENQLIENKEMLQSIFSSMHDLIFIINNEGVFTNFFDNENRNAPLIANPENFMGKKYKEILPQALALKLDKAVSNAKKTGEVQNLTYSISQDKETYWFSANVSILRNKNKKIIGYTMVSRNTTEEVQNQIQLKEAKDYAELMFNTVPSAVFSINKNLEVKSWNKRAEELTGYSKDDVIGQKCVLFNCEEECPFLKSNFTEPIQKGKYLIKTKDGKERYISKNSDLIKDKDGKVIGGIESFEDITEQEEARNKILKNEEKFRNIFDNSSDEIYILEKDGTILDVNEKAIEQNGYSKKELLGMNSVDLKLEKKPTLDQRLKEIEDKGKTIYETKHVNFFGEERDVEISSTLINFEGEERLLSIVRDITYRKEAEDRLRKLSKAVEQSGSSIIITGVDATIEYVNKKFTQVTGYSYDEVIGKRPNILKTGKTPPVVYEQLWKTITSGKEWHGEFCNKKKNGEEFWENASISPIKDANGYITNFLALKEDITYKKEIQEKLKRFREALDYSSDNIFIIDKSTLKFVDVNQSAILNLGYSEKELFQMSPLDIKPYIKKQELEKYFDKALASPSKEVKVETAHQRKNGSIFDVEIFIKALEENTKNLIVAIARDITERKKFEKEQKASKEWMNSIFEGSRDAIFIIDKDGNFADINLAASILTGYSKKELKSFTITEILKKNSIRSFDDFFKTITSGESIINEFNIIKKNGEVIPTEFSNKAIYSRGIAFIHSVVRDVSERKEAEEALKISERRFRSIIEKAPVGICITNNNHVFEYVNPAFYGMLGFKEKEIIGEHFKIVFPGEQWKKIEDKISSKKELLIEGEFDIQKKNGGILSVFTESAKIPFEENEFKTLTFIIDISEQKIAREEIHRALEKEKELHQLKNSFISTVSHEFRTPLAGILSSSKLLEKFQDKWDVDKKKKFYNQISDSVKHLTVLLEEVSLIGKDDSGKLKFTPQKIEIEPFFNWIVEEVESYYNNKLKIKKNIDCRIKDPVMDKTLLRHILTNILSNAVKYTPADNGKVVFNALISENNDLQITIKDNGMGIPKKDIDYIFESFHRAENVENIQGTGLGMAIVKRCLRLHKGKINIESEPGKGTTVDITIPTNQSNE